ncbi:hypothetical protein KUM39_22465 [Streptomyces sp. J2-1]|uniref:hypothetical protein n=1 Tax=Streptomyces corallincola TaxID=2851888 RepID=UPI001C3947FB|nr:hypothetical protein [Streptomyces corallincola]MBV2357104.1 hypothetical protein [Streptomyces corallincola]
MTTGASGYDAYLYARTPSQAEGERDDTDPQEQQPDVPRTEPSQAEGERSRDTKGE